MWIYVRHNANIYSVCACGSCFLKTKEKPGICLLEVHYGAGKGVPLWGHAVEAPLPPEVPASGGV